MPNIVLITVFVLSLLVLKIFKKKWIYALSGRVAMSVMLVTTGIAHFVYVEGMAMMIPEFLPCKMELVYFTGIIEILAAIGLWLSKYYKRIGWLLILFFVLILPANIYGAIHYVDLTTATYSGHGPDYLWVRIPMQLFYIGWVYYSCIWENKLDAK